MQMRIETHYEVKLSSQWKIEWATHVYVHISYNEDFWLQKVLFIAINNYLLFSAKELLQQ